MRIALPFSRGVHHRQRRGLAGPSDAFQRHDLVSALQDVLHRCALALGQITVLAIDVSTCPVTEAVNQRRARAAREEDERRAAEATRRRREEAERVRDLEEGVGAWIKNQRIRAYIAEVENAGAVTAESRPA